MYKNITWWEKVKDVIWVDKFYDISDIIELL